MDARYFLISLATCGALLGQNAKDYVDLSLLLSDSQKAALMRRMWIEKEPFARSSEVKIAKASIGLYFKDKDYALLSGNPALGYYYAPSAFSWVESNREVEFTPLKPVNASTARIQPSAWNQAMQHIAARLGLRVLRSGEGKGRAPRVEGACVRLAGRPGRVECTIEVRVMDPGGHQVLYRKTEARPTAGDAVGAALSQVVSFARLFGKGSGK